MEYNVQEAFSKENQNLKEIQSIFNSHPNYEYAMTGRLMTYLDTLGTLNPSNKTSVNTHRIKCSII
jgi:hypothetical protein